MTCHALLPYPRHRPGHDVVAGHRLRREAAVGRSGPGGVPAAFSRAPAGSSTTRRRSGRACVATCRAAIAQGRHHGRRHRRHRHHQPARDDAGLGPRDRQADPPRHRLAGPPHRRALRGAAQAPATSRRSPPGPACSSTPISPAPRSPGILDHVAGRPRARRARRTCASAPIDSFLIWRLTGGKVHATDATNASRTLLLQHPQRQLGRRASRASSTCRVAMLPEVKDCAADFRRRPRPSCSAAPSPIRGIAGDQQAATIGQACFAPGMMKSTYGTGCFALLNTGRQSGHLAEPAAHHHRLSARAASAPMRWKARSSSPAPRCSGCATASAIIRRCRRDRARWPPPPIPTRRSISCRPSSASARRTGMPRRAAPSSG